MKWRNIKNSRPGLFEPFFYKTRNGKAMVCTGECDTKFYPNGKCDDRFIEQFGVTHWMPVPIETEDADSPVDGSEPIHNWFELTYASYLVLPRVVLQSMPKDWQARFVAMMDEMEGLVEGFPKSGTNYTVHLRRGGKYQNDPLANYERGRRKIPLKAWDPLSPEETERRRKVYLYLAEIERERVKAPMMGAYEYPYDPRECSPHPSPDRSTDC